MASAAPRVRLCSCVLSKSRKQGSGYYVTLERDGIRYLRPRGRVTVLIILPTELVHIIDDDEYLDDNVREFSLRPGIHNIFAITGTATDDISM